MPDWKWAEEDTVVPSVSAVAVYVNARGGITIRQQGEMGERDSVIAFPANYAEAVINGIRKAALEAEHEETEEQ